MKSVLPILSNTEAKDFRACPRLHKFKYLDLYRPVAEAEATRFGSLWHRGLEALFNAIRAGSTQPTVEAFAAMRAVAPVPDPVDLVRAEELLHGYVVRWSGEDLEILAVEAEFRCPLVNPETGAASRTFELGGKIDLIVRSGGRTLICEHKSSGENIGPGSEYWRRLTLDPQISTYFVGARSLGFDPEGCLYDVVGKPRIKLGTVPLTDELGIKIVLNASGARVATKTGKWRETASAADGYVLQTRPETLDEYRARLREDIAANPDRYYQRGEVARLAEDEQEAAFDMWATGRLIREAEIANRHVRNPDACARWGRTCEFFDVCCRTASLEDSTLFRKAERVHEELSPSEKTDAA